MSSTFFEQPIINDPYQYPNRHWELDEEGSPTSRIIDTRRDAKFVTAIPKPKKQKGTESSQPELMGFRKLLVFNDEAHHCYREKPPISDSKPRTSDKKTKRNATIRPHSCGFPASNR